MNSNPSEKPFAWPHLSGSFRKGLFVSGVSSLAFLLPGTAWAACDFSGAILSQHCDTDKIQSRTDSGTSSLTVTGETTAFIDFAPLDATKTPSTHTLTIGAGTVVYNPAYSAVYSQTFAPEHDLEVFIDSDVSITGVDGNGVWLRNDVSGDISIESGATVNASGFEFSAITATTNLGSVYLKNTGHVTSDDFRGLYADGGFNNDALSPALVTIINEGQIDAYEAGARAINYRGLANITNSGVVTSTTKQGLVAWSAAGDTAISNSGTVTALDNIALQAWSSTGDVTVLNTGTLKAYDDTGHADTASHIGLQTYVGTAGNTLITNRGTIEAPDDTALAAEATSGNISITNEGAITGLRGITAATGSGTVDIFNSGSIAATAETGVGLQSASLINDGTIIGGTYGVYFDGSGNVLSNRGSISGATAAVFFGAGGNTLEVAPGSLFSGLVDYNNTTGNTTKFGAGSYRVEAAGYIAPDNTITLDNSGQSVVLDSADTTGTINVVSVAPLGSTIGQYTGSVSDVIGSILLIDIDRPSDIPTVNVVQPLGYAEVDQKLAAAESALTVGSGLAVDPTGNLFWARVFGGVREQSNTSRSAASRTYRYGTITGVDHQFDDTRIGFFVGGGGVESRLKDETSSLDGYTGFFGLYGSKKVNDFLVNASITFGGIDNHSRRSVNAGSEWAEGDFWGWYVSPEVAISKSYALSSAWTATPSIRLRYTGVTYNAFTETGSTQNIAYDRRQSHALDGRVQLDLAHRYVLESGETLAVSFSGALLDTQNLGDSSFSASLGNTGFQINDRAAKNVYGASLGVSFDLQLKSNLSLYGGIEGKVLSREAVDGGAHLGVKVAF